LRGKIPAEVFTQEYKQPVTQGTGAPRENLLKARDLLQQAGWVNKGGALVNAKTGEPFTFEVLLIQESLDRIVLPWFQNLERLGIKGTIRVVDTSQYINRLNEFDYDVVTGGVSNSLSPGNEQLEFWGTAAADRKGSRNLAGVKDPAVDSLINTIMNATDRPSLVTATKALDRVLQWNHYTLLHYNSQNERYAYWAKLQHPEKFPLLGLPAPGESIIETWWMDPKAAAAGAKP
ncbi:MAG: ABC transporter substrate-binding protein, partial [Gammaproteobacteria bacterium]|nr:ABC transporter substrate-binding protein [Gammaproteobacteria bacterium]